MLHSNLCIFVPMKLFAAILSIFFFCLATMPCADAAPAENHSIELAQQQDHDHEGQADNCTPFCHCHCCHVHVTISSNYQTFSNTDNFGVQRINYQDYYSETFLNSLFRPPIV